jgi:hypothetical protein
MRVVPDLGHPRTNIGRRSSFGFMLLEHLQFLHF